MSIQVNKNLDNKIKRTGSMMNVADSIDFKNFMKEDLEMKEQVEGNKVQKSKLKPNEIIPEEIELEKAIPKIEPTDAPKSPKSGKENKREALKKK